MARILITGARGFIGRHLARWHAAQGDQVCGLGHGIWPTSEAAGWGLSHWVNGDINSGNLRLVQQAAGTPDVIHHLAGGSSVGVAIANPREDFFRTVATTAELLEWMRLDAPESRLVAISSAAVYGGGHGGQIGENAKLAPYSPYGFHKHMMEEACRSYASSYGLKVVIARLFSVYGSELKKQLLWDICTRLSRSSEALELGGSGDELRDWIAISDVARILGNVAACAASNVPTLNVGSGVGTSVRDVAQSVIRLWHCNRAGATELRFNGKARSGDPFSLVARCDRLRELGLGTTVDLSAGLAEYVSWYVRETPGAGISLVRDGN